MPTADDPAQDPFDSISATLAETPQGRWFLAEHERRARSRDTERMLEAIAKLDQQVSGRFAQDEIARLKSDIAEMNATIQRTRRHVAELSQGPDQVGPLDDASAALGTIVRTTEQATSDILDAAERIQETAWTMRENGLDPKLCDALDGRATDIYSACVVQDLTAQRIGHVVESLTFLEDRLRLLAQVWGIAPEPHGRPPLERRKLYMTQSDIDFVIVEHDESGCPAEPADTVAPASTPSGAVADPDTDDGYEDVLERIAALEAGDPRERLRLFS